MADREYLLGADGLRDRRVTAGWSQREVARRLGLSPRVVSNLETGAAIAPENVIRAYAALFDEASDVSAAPTPTHDCPGCGSQVEDPLMACRSCFPRLPRELRRIFSYWLPHRFGSPSDPGRQKFGNVQAACLAWLKANPLERGADQ